MVMFPKWVKFVSSFFLSKSSVRKLSMIKRMSRIFVLTPSGFSCTSMASVSFGASALSQQSQ